MAPEDSAKSSWWRAGGAAVPVAMVNGTAFIGQFGFIRTHFRLVSPDLVTFNLLCDILVALTFESIAVFLAWHAHIAMMKNDSASRLKMGAYIFALAMGAMNYSHYAAHWHPTVMAVGMALMSALSPWLWGIHSRRASRDALMEKGLIEEHAVRLGATRWTWHPLRSTRVTSWSTWHGVNDPKRAIARFEPRYGSADTLAEPRRATPERAIVPVAQVVAKSPLPSPARPERATAIAPAAPAAVARQEEPAVHSASARLEAEPRVWNQRKRPPQEVIDNAELALSATSLDNLPSIRKVAEDLLHDKNQRRLAEQLLEARKAAGSSLVEAPSGERVRGNGARPASYGAPDMIAPPSGFRPGGIS